MKMKAAYVKEPGPASSIIYGDLEKPIPKSGEVLVRINVAAINPIDTYVRSGAVKMPIPLPYIIGTDFAGVVESVGPDVFRFHPGDRVWGSNQGLMGRQGVAAEYAAVGAHYLYPTHPVVSDETAAALALVGITAHLGLFRDADLVRGETLFVNGGTGGVGSTVVQMAKAAGARVITTVSTEEKAEVAKKLGADLVINYKKDNIAEAVKQAAPNGVDVWWETIRDPNLELSIPLLAKRGRLVLMAGRDAKPVLPLGAFYTKDCKIVGFAMFNATPDEQHRCAEDISRWAAEGKLHANISRVMPLSEAAAAHQLQEDNTLHKQGTLAGKILLKP
jgi:NADPH2:quinone reductase